MQDRKRDPVARDPQLFTVRFENASVRVLEAKIPSGAGHGMHWHPKHLVCPLSDYAVRDSFPDGSTKEIIRKAGEIVHCDGLMHATVNIGTTDVHALIVEFKE